MLFRKERNAAAALSSLMSQTKDTMVCFDFAEPIDPAEPKDVINRKLRDCRVVEASTPFAKAFGFQRREELIGRPMISLFKNGDIPEWFTTFGQEVEDNNFEDSEQIIKVPVRGELREMRIHMQNIFDDNRLIRQWITIRDVSREERNRRTLKENERLRLLALESVGLQTFSLEYNPDNPDEPYGELTVDGQRLPDWLNGVLDEDRPSLEETFNQFYQGESDRLHTLFRAKKTGAHDAWMEAWAVASERDSDQRPKGVVGVIMDRTQSKALEAQLIDSQRLESLGVLAGGIAHDFNNLLMSITGSVDLALHRHPEVGEELRLIDDAASQATLLCEQLLTYAGRGSAELSPLNISRAIYDFRDLLSLATDKNAHVILHITDNCWVRGDSSQLTQVVMNLVKNSSDALGGQAGEIILDLNTVNYQDSWRTDFHLGTELNPGAYISLAVSDNGKGMSSAQMERIFDPFYTTKFAGRGLGMAVVMGVIRGHGGAIRIDSQAGQGTTVEVVLPVHHSSEEIQPDDDEKNAQRLSGRVLVVDDEAPVREVASNLITAMGAEVVVASGGFEALNLFQDGTAQFDAILMDVTMPDMDGVETASRILDIDPTAKVIMCSGYSHIAIPGKLNNVVSFLQKPYRLGQLQEKLEPLLLPQRTHLS